MRIVDGKLAFGEAPVYRPEPKRPTQIDEAADFLLKMLAEKPLPANDIIAAATQAGIPIPTLRRAKKHLNVRSQRLPDLSWVWSLPQNE
jgi:hypothetical protein